MRIRRFSGYSSLGSPINELLVQMRAAHAVEKMSRHSPHLLHCHKTTLLAELPTVLRQEVRWHIPLLLARLQLTDNEQKLAWEQILCILHDAGESRIVVVNCLLALTDLCLAGGQRRRETSLLIKEAVTASGPAVQARGRKLLAALEIDLSDSQGDK